MEIANIQAQLANLTSQLSMYVEMTTRQIVPTFGASYRQEYPANQHPQRGWENVNTWGYQDHNQSGNSLFSNMYNSDWSDHSNSMWWESQQVQHEGYWQPYEEFYSRPAQPPQPHIQYAQPNSGSSIDYNQILDDLISSVQGSQNQDKEAQQEEYLPPSEEFYQWPYAPSQPPPQSSQTNSGSSMDTDQIIQLLTTLAHEQENQTKRMQNRAKKMDELEKHIGQIMEFMAQIQEQSELSNSTIENLKENFEIHDAITLESGMEGGTSPKTSKPSQNMDEQLLFEEEEDDKATAREEPPLPQPTLALLPLPQPPNAPPLSNTGKLGLIFVNSNPIPPNVPFPRRFLIPKQEESEKDIVAALPKVQNDIPILGATKQVLDCVEFFKGLCTPRRMIQEKEVAGEYQEFIKEDVFETTNAKEVEFDDTGQAPTIIVNMAKFKVPETFKEVVFAIEFVSEQASKSSSPISNSFYTNLLLILMIQAPTLEFKPLPDHFKYHLPFKDA